MSSSLTSEMFRKPETAAVSRSSRNLNRVVSHGPNQGDYVVMGRYLFTPCPGMLGDRQFLSAE